LPDLLSEYGLDDRVSTLFDSVDLQEPDPTLLGRVVRVERTNCLVATSGAVVRAALGCPVAPAAGDWVVLIHRPGSEITIAEVLQRKSALSRRAPEDRGGYEQVLAANVDVLALVAPVDRPSSMNRLERMLVLGWDSGARPVVVLTKCDLVGDPDELERLVAEAERAALGVEVIATSAETGAGVERLRETAGAGTLAFVGPSGAGKSTLVNALVGSDVQKTGDVRGADKRGKHTTTSRDLILLPGGGVLLDTPGLRSLGLIDAPDSLATTFADIENLAESCQFGDCSHTTEPLCAVRKSIEQGTLSARRLESYRKLQRELMYEQRRLGGPRAVALRREWMAEHRRLLRNAGPTRMDQRRQRHR
jgi:ribosome biogenesis GTPase